MRTHKTRFRLWFAMTVLVFIALGQFVRAPSISGSQSYFHFVSEFVRGWLTGADERCDLASIALLLGAWFVIAAALGWFLHMVVLILFREKGENQKPSA